MAHMYIMNPLAGRKGDGLFTTHPATANRIAALRKMGAEMGIVSDRGPRSSVHTPGPWG